MTTTYAPPAPPLADGELTVSVHRLRIELVRGRFAGCCLCKGPCFTWWSRTPPSGYVPLHDHCAPRMIERWRQMLADGDTEPEVFMAPPSGRRGAYARRAATAASVDAIVAPVRLATGAMLPPGFTPGPFWLPGDDEFTPWTVLLETAAGHTVCPAGANRAHAVKVFGGYRTLPQINFGPVIAGAALIGPDGAVADSWGSVPTPGTPRWEPIHVLSEWKRCTGGCGALRWPGSWETAAGWCRECQAAQEAGDPREWPDGASFPGERYIPESFTKVARIIVPAAAARRFRPSLKNGFTSQRKRG